MKTALVLSGGGMFGAWQAGAWRALEQQFQPDLIIGASAGALNGYAIASGWSGEELCASWLDPSLTGFRNLPKAVGSLLAARPLQCDYAAVVVDLLRMQPVTIPAHRITAQHLLASCAVPGATLPKRVDGRWYVDGGLLNPLPVWAAVELGATRIIALQALPQFPSPWISPFVKAFRAVFGHHPALPAGVELITLFPSVPLGSLADAFLWHPARAARWLKQGADDAKNISIQNCIER